MAVRRVVVLVAVLVAVVATVATGCGSSARPAPAAPRPPAPITPDRSPLPTTAATAPRMIRDAVPVGPGTAWAWTSTAEGLGPERIERTTDGGRTWSDVTPPALATATRARLIQGFYALDANHAWVGYGSLVGEVPATFLATADGGASWTALGPAPRPGCRLQFVNPHDGWCVWVGAAMGSTVVAVYRTHDGGRTWREASANRPSASAATPPGALPFGCGKQITFTDTRTGWAGFGCNGGGAEPPLYRSTDGGAHWDRVPVPAPPGVRIDGGSSFGTAVARGDRVAIPYSVWGTPGATFVYSSADAGSTWTRTRLPDVRAGWSLALSSPTHWDLLAGNRLRITDDGGRQWRTVRMDHRFGRLPVGALRDATDHTLWLFTLTALWRSADDGRHWTRLRPP